MSQMEITWEPEKDPLEIEEEIFIKDEIINPFNAEFINSKDFHIINQTNIKRLSTISDEEIVLSNLPGGSNYSTEINQTDNTISTTDEELVALQNLPGSTYSGAKKIVNIKKVNVNNSESNLLHSSNKQIRPSSTNSVLKNTEKNNSACNCMRYIELYCTKCDYRIFFRKNVSQCFECHNLLKLRCKKCTKRYKYLNSIHQYILQSTKRLNLFENSKKQVTFKCKKVQNYFCSKCTFKTTEKELLQHHTKFRHVTVNPKDISLPVSDSVSTPISKPTSNLVANPVPHSVSSVSNNGRKNLAINGPKDDDQFIEYYCFNCKTTQNRRIYPEGIKPMCETCNVQMSYRCELCKKTYFTILKNLRTHIRNTCLQRFDRDNLYCSHCDYKTVLKSELEFHIRTNHELLECDTCSIKFKGAVALKDHKTKGCLPGVETEGTVQTPEDVDGCDLDSEDMISNSKYKTYKITKNFPQALMKDIIMRPRNYKTLGWSYYCLQCHKDGKNNNTKYKSKCPECEVKYDYRCTRCDKLYGAYENMYRHIQLCHTQTIPLECSLCDYTNTRRHRLLLHIKNKHTIYQCLICNKLYEGYITLGRHKYVDCTGVSQLEGISITDIQTLIARFCKVCRKTEYKDDDDSLPCDKCSATMCYKCLKCNEKFKAYTVAYKHVKDACEPKFHCGNCDYKAHNDYDLNLHIELAHTNDRKSADCEIKILSEKIIKHNPSKGNRKRKSRVDKTDVAVK